MIKDDIFFTGDTFLLHIYNAGNTGRFLIFFILFTYLFFGEGGERGHTRMFPEKDGS